jgi:hypothetical protein
MNTDKNICPVALFQPFSLSAFQPFSLSAFQLFLPWPPPSRLRAFAGNLSPALTTFQ